MANQLAFVTGASAGIGYNLAKVLAERGYDLIITAEQEKLSAAADELRAHGVSVTPIQADARKPEEVERVWSQVQSAGRKLDVACINAGIGEGGLFATESDLQTELDIVRLNCESTVHFAKRVAAHMVANKSGRILFTASVVSEMVAPREAVYAASKAFVLSLAKSLRFEMKDDGVSVTALQPGPTDTEFFDRGHMSDTEVGTKGKKQSEPYDVAKDGIDALLAGDEHVYAHAFALKVQGALMGLVPESVQAAMHNKQSSPVKQ